ncbi:hypothetical protein KBE46_02910 [Candidatus Saccharibacteria bacterium]|nr:hypothetical protein [Candidatus Saccharibacteria bacterium]MBP9489201.1 hypothetical protein [Candidatus Saccharibacteria bacterium]MBP9552454.1 hypothetical protein [Candidatus Saccharibacteria bacterium]
MLTAHSRTHARVVEDGVIIEGWKRIHVATGRVHGISPNTYGFIESMKNSDEAFISGVHSFAKQIYEGTANKTFGTEGCDKLITFFHEHWPSFIHGRNKESILFENHLYIIRQKYNPGLSSLVVRYINPNKYSSILKKIS